VALSLPVQTRSDFSSDLIFAYHASGFQNCEAAIGFVTHTVLPYHSRAAIAWQGFFDNSSLSRHNSTAIARFMYVGWFV